MKFNSILKSRINFLLFFLVIAAIFLSSVRSLSDFGRFAYEIINPFFVPEKWSDAQLEKANKEIVTALSYNPNSEVLNAYKLYLQRVSIVR